MLLLVVLVISPLPAAPGSGAADVAVSLIPPATPACPVPPAMGSGVDCHASVTAFWIVCMEACKSACTT